MVRSTSAKFKVDKNGMVKVWWFPDPLPLAVVLEHEEWASGYIGQLETDLRNFLNAKKPTAKRKQLPGKPSPKTRGRGSGGNATRSPQQSRRKSK